MPKNFQGNEGALAGLTEPLTKDEVDLLAIAKAKLKGAGVTSADIFVSELVNLWHTAEGLQERLNRSLRLLTSRVFLENARSGGWVLRLLVLEAEYGGQDGSMSEDALIHLRFSEDARTLLLQNV
jgi:hypothetical protein